MIKILILAIILFSTNVYAAAPTRQYSYTPNTVIDSTENNANENALYSYLQVGVDTYAASSITGAAISSSASIPYISLSLGNSIVNADISTTAAIVDTKLSQITTASKVSGTAITGLASLPGAAGVIPIANIPALTSFTQYPYVKITNTQVQNTAGGTATSGGWTTVPLTTEDNDTGGIATLAASKITLPSGTYTVSASCPFYTTNNSQVRLYNNTDASVLLIGSSVSSDSANNGNPVSLIKGQITLSASKDLYLQYQVETTAATNGLGHQANFGGEVYAIIEFTKVN